MIIDCHTEDSYHNVEFFRVIHDLFTQGLEDFSKPLYCQYCARAPKVVTEATTRRCFMALGYFGESRDYKLS